MVESLHFDIQITGQKSHCVLAGPRPSQCYVLIRQSDSPLSAPVLGRPLGARRTGRGRSPPRDLPGPPPAVAGGPQQPGEPPREITPASAASPGPDAPGPQSQSLSRSYGIRFADFPYPRCSIGQSCSPRRPAAVMGTSRRGRLVILPPADFRGRPGRAGPGCRRRALPASRPLSPGEPVPGRAGPLRRKENSSRGLGRRLRARPRRRPRCPRPGAGILDRLPFRRAGRVSSRKAPALSLAGLPCGSGSAHPRATAVRAEPFPLRPSGIPPEYLLLPPRSAPGAARPGLAAPGFAARPPRPPTPPGLGRPAAGGGVWAGRLSAIHFRGRHIRQVGCYTVLGGFRLPWPPPCCQDVPTPFVVSRERPLRRLNPAFGSSRIASSAYQKRPTSAGAFEGPRPPGRRGLLTHSEFENGWRLRKRPRVPNHSLYLINCEAFLSPGAAILRETSAETSYQTVRLVFRPHARVRRSICTSEPLRASTRVSPGFALRRHSSPSFGSERPRSCSGPSARLGTGRRCAPPKGSHLRSPSLRVGASGAPVHSRGRSTPWSVFQDGPPATVEPASWPPRRWRPRRRDPRPAEPGRREPGSVRAPPRRGDHVPPVLLPGRGPALARTARVAACGPPGWGGVRGAAPRRPSSGRGRFPPGNFTCCLTLFPGCFSSFDHSTCALSVSGRYLALEGIYLPLWAALPSYPTRRGTRPPAAVRARGARPHGLSPSMAPRSRGLGRRASRSPARGGRRLPLQAATRAPRVMGGAGLQIWAVAASLAATGAIPVGFFSSAY